MPLFSERIGSSPVSTLAVDALHTLMLGPVMRYISAAVWRVVLRNPFKVQKQLEPMIETTVSMLRTDLKTWMQDPANGIPKSRQLAKLTVKMLGRRLKRSTQERFSFLSSPILLLLLICMLDWVGE